MDQQTLLTMLVMDQYQCQNVKLQPIAQFVFEDRGIYRVDLGDGRFYVLRAFHCDLEAELSDQVATLHHLGQHGFVVPHVLRTKTGSTIATYENWMALMISFIEGAMADFSPQSLALLGAYVANLHALSAKTLAERGTALLPDSRLSPNQVSQEALDQIVAEIARIPQTLRPFYEASLTTIQRLQQAVDLPVTIIHGDCWSNNAVLMRDGHIAMIDWDGAGLGLAILDLGYLLMTCHLSKLGMLEITPDPQRIAAVVHGYCQRRIPNADELMLLGDAVLYDSARRAILAGVDVLTSGNWQENTLLLKMLGRYRASEEVTAIALRCFEAELIDGDKMFGKFGGELKG